MAEDRHASTCGVIKRGREMTADTLQDKHPDHAIVQEKAYWAPDNNIGWSKRDLQAASLPQCLTASAAAPPPSCSEVEFLPTAISLSLL